MNLPPLPALPLPALPYPQPQGHQYSPWFPMDRAPWQPGRYEMKYSFEGIESTAFVSWDGTVWATADSALDSRFVLVSWRGLAGPVAVL